MPLVSSGFDKTASLCTIQNGLVARDREARCNDLKEHAADSTFPLLQ